MKRVSDLKSGAIDEEIRVLDARSRLEHGAETARLMPFFGFLIWADDAELPKAKRILGRTDGSKLIVFQQALAKRDYRFFENCIKAIKAHPKGTKLKFPTSGKLEKSEGIDARVVNCREILGRKYRRNPTVREITEAVKMAMEQKGETVPNDLAREVCRSVKKFRLPVSAGRIGAPRGKRKRQT